MSTRRWLIWRRLRRLYQGFRHPGTPWWAKGLVILILIYGISPVDLVPDLVPLVGWLDDATLLMRRRGFDGPMLMLSANEGYRFVVLRATLCE